ncbi:MAG: C69 family dipeptidase [Olsenella sp.]|nr:C69 family dipeptidase [Olsenella sp.]
MDDYDDAIVSKELESLPKERGFARYGTEGKDGRLNLRLTYSGDETLTDYSHMRTWIGHQLLAGGYDAYDAEGAYPLCFNPKGKVTLEDVMAVMRNRFEGTEYSPDGTGRTDMRVIGTDAALSVHVAQVHPELPADRSCVTWESTGPCVYGVFVPLSNAATSVNESYGRSQPAKDKGAFDAQAYPYYAFKELTTLCVEPDSCKV